MGESDEALPGQAVVWVPRCGCASSWCMGQTSALLSRGCWLPFCGLGVGLTSPGRPT